MNRWRMRFEMPATSVWPDYPPIQAFSRLSASRLRETSLPASTKTKWLIPFAFLKFALVCCGGVAIYGIDRRCVWWCLCFFIKSWLHSRQEWFYVQHVQILARGKTKHWLFAKEVGQVLLLLVTRAEFPQADIPMIWGPALKLICLPTVEPHPHPVV